MIHESKLKTYSLLQKLATTPQAVADVYEPNATWHGVYPWMERSGISEITEVWSRIHNALPDLERRDDIFVGGENLPDPRYIGERQPMLTATLGAYQGTFAQPLLGIKPTQQPVLLRSCEAHALGPSGKIIESWVTFDLLDLMDQAGQWPLDHAPLGARGPWPGPATTDGVRLRETDGASGAAAMETVLKMHAALGDYDGVDPATMKHAQYWDKKFMWYGPGGIGMTRAMAGFQNQHQFPFLDAFPDRGGASHYIRIGDGNYAVTGGRPSVTATHTGPFLGLPPSVNKIDMTVMDFYRVQDGVICENWVPIDIIYMAHQMGHDLLP